MIRIDGEDIFITRGDSGEFSISPMNDSGVPYFLAAGETVMFYVRPLPRAEPVIVKEFTAAEQDGDGAFTVSLSPADTDIPRADYMYEVKLYSADEHEICTFIGGDKLKPRFVVM